MIVNVQKSSHDADRNCDACFRMTLSKPDGVGVQIDAVSRKTCEMLWGQWQKPNLFEHGEVQWAFILR